MKFILLLVISLGLSHFLHAQTENESLMKDSVEVMKYVGKANQYIAEIKIDSFYFSVDNVIEICKKNKGKSKFFNLFYFKSNTMKLEIVSQDPEIKKEKALEMALRFRQEIIDKKENDEYYADITLIIAHLYFYLEQYQNTINASSEAYNKGYREFMKRSKHSHSFTTTLAGLLETKGNAENRLYAYHSALVSYQRSLSMFEKLYKNSTSFKQPLVNLHANIADAYTNLYELDSAKRYYQLADSILEYSPKNSTYYAYKSKISGNIGRLYAAKKMYEKSFEYQEKCIEFGKKVFLENDAQWITNYRMYAISLNLLGRTDEALEYLIKSSAIIKKHNNGKNTNDALNHLHFASIYYYDKNDSQKSLEHLQKSLYHICQIFSDSTDIAKNPSIEDTVKYSGHLMNVMRLKAKICDNINTEKHKKIAEETYQMLEQISDKYQFTKCFLPDDFLEYRGNTSIIITEILAYYLRINNKIKAFEMSEKNKYYLLYEKIRQHGQSNNTKMGYKISTSNYLNTVQIQSQLSDNQILLEYARGEDNTYLFAIDKQHFEVFELGIHPDSLEKQIKVYRATLFAPENDTKRVHFKLGTILYQLLISPARKLLKDKKHLIIIPEGELAKLPFETLFEDIPKSAKQLLAEDPRNIFAIAYSSLPYLIKDYQVSYYPSATLIFSDLGRVNVPTTVDFMAFAPIFKNDPETLIQSRGTIQESLKSEEEEVSLSMALLDAEINRSITVMKDGRLEYLKYSQIEVDSITYFFQQKNKKIAIYLDSMATEQNMKAHAGKAKILHFATHGFFNSFNTDKSAIAAYQPKQTIYDESIKNEQAAEDGMLFTDEVFGMWLNADLVVLSSCQGGLGRYVPGEGIMAITRAFLYAGANSMIYSLWKVSDKHTKDLMISFYLNVLAGKDYPEALQLAKIKLLNNNKDDALPRFWAGFVLNWKPE